MRPQAESTAKQFSGGKINCMALITVTHPCIWRPVFAASPKGKLAARALRLALVGGPDLELPLILGLPRGTHWQGTHPHWNHTPLEVQQRA